jgi:hypothetical protein
MLAGEHRLEGLGLVLVVGRRRGGHLGRGQDGQDKKRDGEEDEFHGLRRIPQPAYRHREYLTLLKLKSKN